jgi:hypothetical protein
LCSVRRHRYHLRNPGRGKYLVLLLAYMCTRCRPLLSSELPNGWNVIKDSIVRSRERSRGIRVRGFPSSHCLSMKHLSLTYIIGGFSWNGHIRFSPYSMSFIFPGMFDLDCFECSGYCAS